jgi:mono/diheme cytochrome c family protein
MNANRKTTAAGLRGILGGIALIALGAFAGVASSAAQSQSENKGFDVFSGRVTFHRYCASCHGREAHGDGNVAQYLKVPPADLTQLRKKYDGTFPVEQVHEFIDGRRAVAGHGTREMPVWGEVFQSSLAEPQATPEAGDERADRIIHQLVMYLESIQVD